MKSNFMINKLQNHYNLDIILLSALISVSHAVFAPRFYIYMD